MSNHPTSDASAQGAGAGPAQAPSDQTQSAQTTEGGAAAPASASPSGEDAASGSQDAAADSSPATPTPEERIGQLEAEKAQLARDKQDHWDRLLRTTADLDNLRKRSRRELDDARTEARTKVLREMLPVMDNLERAMEHAQSETTGAGGAGAASVIEGVKLVLRQFAQALERCDVVAVDAVGKPFDPNLHEAISQVESAEHAPGSVVQALQKGYTIGNRLLRPALVVVAKAPREPAPGSDGSNGSGSGDGSGNGAGSGSSSGEA